MPISETQFDTWSHQGAIAGSRDTYHLIKDVLEENGSPYAQRNFKVFLQGSYRNDTNIYAESDVDIVIQLNSAFRYEFGSMSVEQKNAIQKTFTAADYVLDDFRRDVLEHLQARFVGSVTNGEKAIVINSNKNRRKADVIVCMEFRKFTSFHSPSSFGWDEGIWFKSASGMEIANYPKLHTEYLTAHHQATSQWLKPTIRIFKNIRKKMTEEGLISPGDAPSYFIEGMLYNVPVENFGSTYVNTFQNCLAWLNSAARDDLICANERYRLLHPYSPVTWRTGKYDAFINAAIRLWNDW